MIKPGHLKPGDKVATISPSSGIAGEPSIKWRYDLGARRLREIFGFEVVAMPNSLRGIDFNDNNPEARAEDFMLAFSDDSIKGVICNIGGEDSIRMLPHLDLSVIRGNPKVLTGFSDATTVHMICRKAGLLTFYGPALLTDFAENSGIFSYTYDYFKRAVMDVCPVGRIEPSSFWTSEFLDWNDRRLNSKARLVNNCGGFKLAGGAGYARGRLLGGCLSVLYRIRDTAVFPSADEWKGTIAFIETSEAMPPPSLFEEYLRGIMGKGALVSSSGIIFARPYGNMYEREYSEILANLISRECSLSHIPILTGLPFGHTSPMITIPIGVEAEIDAANRRFEIIEPGVI